jgi:hypothetical protein
MANGKYVTFNFGDDGYLLKEDIIDRFIVTADIVGGADRDITFKLDKNLDVMAN